MAKPEGGVVSSLVDGVWTATGPVRIVGMPLATTMTILRLGDGSLLVHSPIAMSGECREAVESLGEVAHLYAPNLFHHRWLGEWASAFPSARVHAPDGLSKKHPGVRIDRVHGSVPEAAFEGVVDELRLEGFRLGESVLFHRPSRVLVVADLVHNVGRPEDGWTKLYTRAMGFHDRVALSRLIRWTGVSDREALRRSLDVVLALPFDRIVVGHGEPIEDGAGEVLAAACAWV